jgi:hypothetical protein
MFIASVRECLLAPEEPHVLRHWTLSDATTSNMSLRWSENTRPRLATINIALLRSAAAI